jgi:hypothetical protein
MARAFLDIEAFVDQYEDEESDYDNFLDEDQIDQGKLHILLYKIQNVYQNDTR